MAEFWRLSSRAKSEFLLTKWINTRTNIALTQARWSGNRTRDGKTAFQLAERQYVPTEYRGRVILFRTREGTSADPEGIKRAWSRVAPGLELREASGTHDDMLSTPHVKGLADMVLDCMEEPVECTAKFR
jgi:thioesterase domain-containing protein